MSQFISTRDYGLINIDDITSIHRDRSGKTGIHRGYLKDGSVVEFFIPDPDTLTYKVIPNHSPELEAWAFYDLTEGKPDLRFEDLHIDKFAIIAWRVSPSDEQDAQRPVLADIDYLDSSDLVAVHNPKHDSWYFYEQQVRVAGDRLQDYVLEHMLNERKFEQEMRQREAAKVAAQ